MDALPIYNELLNIYQVNTRKREFLSNRPRNVNEVAHLHHYHLLSQLNLCSNISNQPQKHTQLCSNGITSTREPRRQFPKENGCDLRIRKNLIS